MKSRISASTNCFVKPDRSITAAVLSSKRIFAEEFVVVRRDPSKVQFIARLNDFYFQFQKLGNNCVPVKAI